MTRANKYKLGYFATAFTGICLMVPEIHLYRKTIIHLTPLTAVMLIPALAIFFLIKAHYKKVYHVKSFFFPFLQSVVSAGFISCYSFLALNYYFADEESGQLQLYTILSKTTIGGRKALPAVEINYHGMEKELVFYAGQKEDVKVAKTVVLTAKKGFFGYDVLGDIKLN